MSPAQMNTFLRGPRTNFPEGLQAPDHCLSRLSWLLSRDSSPPLSTGPLCRSALAVRAASVHISETWLKEGHPVCSSNSGIPVSCSPLGPTWARQVWEGLGGLTRAPRTESLWLSPSQHETGS